MKIKYLVAVVLMVISISACSNQRKLEKSAYNYPNSSITGTTVQLIAQNVAKYDLTIDDSISIYVSFKAVNNFILPHLLGMQNPLIKIRHHSDMIEKEESLSIMYHQATTTL
jgi:hypothetical protein